MLTLLTSSLLLSIAIMGLYVAFQWPGMIFRSVKDHLDGFLPEWISKPVYGCPICMSSVWTMIFSGWLYLNGLPLFPVVGWQYIGLTLMLIPAVAGINTFLCIGLDKFTDYGC